MWRSDIIRGTGFAQGELRGVMLAALGWADWSISRPQMMVIKGLVSRAGGLHGCRRAIYVERYELPTTFLRFWC